jgi:hypothetical protein
MGYFSNGAHLVDTWMTHGLVNLYTYLGYSSHVLANPGPKRGYFKGEKTRKWQQKTLPARRSRVTHMKFLRKLLLEKAMAETMRDNKVTNIPNTNQYHLVVVFNTCRDHIFISYMFLMAVRRMFMGVALLLVCKANF